MIQSSISPRLATAALCALLLASPPAGSHQVSDPHLHARFDGIAPDLPQVKVEVRNQPPSPPMIVLSNASQNVVEITGTGGEPMVRIGPKGVEVNRTSRTFYLSQDAIGEGGFPPSARPGAAPVWATVTTRPEWRWFERRIAAAGHKVAPEVLASAKRPVDLGSWSIPGRVGDAVFHIEGKLFWRPILGSIRSRVSAVQPKITGLEVRLLPGAVPGMFVANRTDKTLEISGRDGMAFARIGPSGVEINENSPTWRDTKNQPPAKSAEPSWKKQQETPLLSWLERRAAFESDDPPEIVEQSGRRLVLVTWTIGASLDRAPLRIRGVTEWVPIGKATSEGRPWLPLAGGAGGLAVLAAGIIFALRRSGRHRPHAAAPPRRKR